MLKIHKEKKLKQSFFDSRFGRVFLKVWPIIIILTFVLIPIHLFKKDLMIAGGDFAIYLDPSNLLSNYIYSWYEKMQAGMPNFSLAQVFPFFSFWWFFKKVGIHLSHIQLLWVSFYYVLSGLSIYSLTQYLLRKSGLHSGISSKLGGILSSSLYMVNMFTGIDMLQPSLRPVQAVLPLMILFWMKGLETKSAKYAFFLAAGSLLYGSANINLATVSSIYIILLSYLIFFLFISRSKVKDILKFVFITVFLVLGFNLWWVISGISAMFQVAGGTKVAASGFSVIGQTHLVDAFRFLGFWAWKGDYEGLLLHPYAQIFDQFPRVFLTYFITTFSFFVFMKKTKKDFLFFGLLAVLGLFLTKGGNIPFGQVYKFLYLNLPGFWVFREPFSKFTLINLFSISVLFGLSFSTLVGGFLTYFKKPKIGILRAATFCVFVVLLATILIDGSPLLSSEVIMDKKFRHIRSLYVQTPTYWRDLSSWLNKDNIFEKRVFILPKSAYGHAYDWEHGITTAGPVAQILLLDPLISYSFPPVSVTDELINSIHDKVTLKKNDNLVNALAMMDVKYILQQNDLDYNNQLNSIVTLAPDQMKRALSLYPEIVKVKTFGKLDLYEIKEENQIPKIFSPAINIYSQIKVSDLLSFNLPLFFKDRIFFFFVQLNFEAKEKIASISEYFIFKVVKIINPEKRDSFKINSPVNSEFLLLGQKEPSVKVKLIKGENELKFSSDVIPSFVYARRLISKNEAPLIIFKKVNPTRYEVSIKKAKMPFILFFSESYNPDWKISFKNGKVLNSSHFMANGFGNSWLINETGDIDLVIYYQKQRQLNFSWIASGTILLFSFLLIFVFKKNKSLSNEKN